jgi:hypothetical protein
MLQRAKWMALPVAALLLGACGTAQKPATGEQPLSGERAYRAPYASRAAEVKEGLASGTCHVNRECGERRPRLLREHEERRGARGVRRGLHGRPPRGLLRGLPAARVDLRLRPQRGLDVPKAGWKASSRARPSEEAGAPSSISAATVGAMSTAAICWG